MRQALQESRRFDAPPRIEALEERTRPVISAGAMMGEGWFLTGEMIELIEQGIDNVVCMQPFACLPNQISGKGMIKKLKKRYPGANITAIDYDPGASEVNQLNRIKLMLSVTFKKLYGGKRGKLQKIDELRGNRAKNCACSSAGPLEYARPSDRVTIEGF